MLACHQRIFFFQTVSVSAEGLCQLISVGYLFQAWPPLKLPPAVCRLRGAQSATSPSWPSWMGRPAGCCCSRPLLQGCARKLLLALALLLAQGKGRGMGARGGTSEGRREAGQDSHLSPAVERKRVVVRVMAPLAGSQVGTQLKLACRHTVSEAFPPTPLYEAQM